MVISLAFAISQAVCSLSAATAAGSPRPRLIATPLPRFSCPDPALADMLASDILRLGDGHHLGAVSAVVPHSNVHPVVSAAVAPTSGVSAEVPDRP